LAQFLGLLAKILKLLWGHGSGVLKYLGANPLTGDGSGLGALEELASDRDLERGTLPAAGSIYVSDRGVVFLCLCGCGGGQERGQGNQRSTAP
jgi:hypothetical protein